MFSTSIAKIELIFRRNYSFKKDSYLFKRVITQFFEIVNYFEITLIIGLYKKEEIM